MPLKTEIFSNMYLISGSSLTKVQHPYSSTDFQPIRCQQYPLTSDFAVQSTTALFQHNSYFRIFKIRMYWFFNLQAHIYLADLLLPCFGIRNNSLKAKKMSSRRARAKRGRSRLVILFKTLQYLTLTQHGCGVIIESDSKLILSCLANNRLMKITSRLNPAMFMIKFLGLLCKQMRLSTTSTPSLK